MIRCLRKTSIMESFLQSTLVIHIISGTVALVSGLLAMGLFKRTQQHRKAGKLFFYAMTMIFATAVSLAAIKGLSFLLCIAFLSYYSAFRGVRALKFLRGSSVRWYDGVAGVLVILCGMYLSLRGYRIFIVGNTEAAIIHLAFGGLTILLAIGGLLELIRSRKQKVNWFRVHKSAMGGALIATMTAFSVTALSFLPDIVAWLGPTIVLSPVLSLVIRSSERGSKALG